MIICVEAALYFMWFGEKTGSMDDIKLQKAADERNI